jgi:hypothetical protein
MKGADVTVICHIPKETIFRPGVATVIMQRPWSLAKGVLYNARAKMGTTVAAACLADGKYNVYICTAMLL